MDSKNSIILIIIFIAVGAGSFYGGIQYDKKQTTQSLQTRQGARVRGSPGQNGFNGARGEIISIDDKSLTLKLADGSSKIVLVNDKTTIDKTTKGSKSDLQTGQQIMVFGTQNSDGSITAQSVQLNPRTRPDLPTQ